jgi:radical SAM protein with 4Fe4S-binding SPASM domain
MDVTRAGVIQCDEPTEVSMATKQEIYESQSEKGRLREAGAFPSVVLLDSISYCNLLCSMCFHKDMTRKRGLMPWDRFVKIIDEVAEKRPDARVWMVFFGEALIIKKRKPTIFDMIKYAKSKGLSDVVLNSNANLLDDQAARDLIDSGLDAIYIGIDAATPETYAKVRVGGNYDKVVKNVLNLLDIQKQTGVDHPKVFVQFVEMDINQHEVSAFVEFWKDKGANVKIRPKVSWAGKVDAPNLVLGDEERWPCYWAMHSMSITDQGKVVTCAVDLDAGWVAGDVNTHSLEEIWNQSLKEFRRKHLDGEFSELPPICRDCRDWQSARADYY